VVLDGEQKWFMEKFATILFEGTKYVEGWNQTQREDKKEEIKEGKKVGITKRKLN
jgi:hypothetical protein